MSREEFTAASWQSWAANSSAPLPGRSSWQGLESVPSNRLGVSLSLAPPLFSGGSSRRLGESRSASAAAPFRARWRGKGAKRAKQAAAPVAARPGLGQVLGDNRRFERLIAFGIFQRLMRVSAVNCCFPLSPFGPVLLRALWRFASICRRDVIEDSTRPRRPAQLGFLQRLLSASRLLGAAKAAESLSLVVGLQ
jgi:hypothetical protein